MNFCVLSLRLSSQSAPASLPTLTAEKQEIARLFGDVRLVPFGNRSKQFGKLLSDLYAALDCARMAAGEHLRHVAHRIGGGLLTLFERLVFIHTERALFSSLALSLPKMCEWRKMSLEHTPLNT